MPLKATLTILPQESENRHRARDGNDLVVRFLTGLYFAPYLNAASRSIPNWRIERMPQKFFSLRNKRFMLLLFLVIVSGSALVWINREHLLASYYVHRLTRAGDEDREEWVQRVAGLGEASVSSLLHALANKNRQGCANAKEALRCLTANWGSNDPRTEALLLRLGDTFAQFSSSGQNCVLEVVEELYHSRESAQPPGPSFYVRVGRLLCEAGSDTDARVLSRALALAGEVAAAKHTEAVRMCRELVQASLRTRDTRNRIEAIRLALRPEFNLIEAVAPLLSHDSAAVRRAALLAVGPAAGDIATDDLLHWLHDPDEDVRRLCEKALLGRGLNAEQVKLGRLMTDERPQVRLGVFEVLKGTSDLDQGIWLRRLSHDDSPAIRAAAVRAAVEQPQLDLRDRLEQMSQNDPSITVRQLAQHYLYGIAQSTSDKSHAKVGNK